MARLDELRERPVGEHAEVYADLHERLQSALVEADAEPGDRSSEWPRQSSARGSTPNWYGVVWPVPVSTRVSWSRPAR